jgi:hypothetical protein
VKQRLIGKSPVIAKFADEEGNDVMQQVIEHNYNQIKTDVKQIVTDELRRIESDPDLKHLINPTFRRFSGKC